MLVIVVEFKVKYSAMLLGWCSFSYSNLCKTLKGLFMWRFKCVEDIWILVREESSCFAAGKCRWVHMMHKYFLVTHPLACFLSASLIMHISCCSTYFYPLWFATCYQLGFHEASLYLSTPHTRLSISELHMVLMWSWESLTHSVEACERSHC